MPIAMRSDEDALQALRPGERRAGGKLVTLLDLDATDLTVHLGRDTRYPFQNRGAHQFELLSQ